MINAGQPVPARELTPIIGGILARESAQPDTLKTYMANCPFINLGCSVKGFSFVVRRDNSNAVLETQCSSQEESILSFFYIILDFLHKLGTVACLDIRDYADATIDSIKLPREDS